MLRPIVKMMINIYVLVATSVIEHQIPSAPELIASQSPQKGMVFKRSKSEMKKCPRNSIGTLSIIGVPRAISTSARRFFGPIYRKATPAIIYSTHFFNGKFEKDMAPIFSCDGGGRIWLTYVGVCFVLFCRVVCYSTRMKID